MEIHRINLACIRKSSLDLNCFLLMCILNWPRIKHRTFLNGIKRNVFFVWIRLWVLGIEDHIYWRRLSWGYGYYDLRLLQEVECQLFIILFFRIKILFSIFHFHRIQVIWIFYRLFIFSLPFILISWLWIRPFFVINKWILSICSIKIRSSMDLWNLTLLLLRPF